MDHIDTSINYIFRPEKTVGMSMGNKLWALQICLSCNRTINIFVRLLMGYHSNADNKFMDDHKTDISFEGKNGSKKEY